MTRRCGHDAQRKCHPSFSPHRLPRVLRVVPRPVGMLLSFQTRHLDVSNIFLCAAESASSRLLEFRISTSNHLASGSLQSSCLMSLFKMTLQHSSLRFDFSHTNLCEAIRCVVPFRARMLAPSLRHLSNSSLPHGETPAMHVRHRTSTTIVFISNCAAIQQRRPGHKHSCPSPAPVSLPRIQYVCICTPNL